MKVKRLTHWTPEADAGLNQVMGDDRDDLCIQIENGMCQLWYLPKFDSWMITRSEPRLNQAPVLVICCYQGKGLVEVGQHIVKAAQQQDFAGIRYHTQRKGLNRLLKPFGFEKLETVYYKPLIG